MTLTDMLTGRFGEICLIRIGEAIHLKNREDIDILVAVSKRPLKAALIPPAALCDELKITRLEGKYHA